MLSFFGRTSQVISVIFLSFVLGAILAGLTAVYSPPWFDYIIDSASDLKAWLSNGWLPLEINVWFKFLLKDESLILMFFTLIARLILYAFFGIFNFIRAYFSEPELTRGEINALIDENNRLKHQLKEALRAAKPAQQGGLGKIG